MARATFKRAARVTSKRDFERARKGGRVLGDAVLRISVLANGLATTRLGLAVPRRGSNVERNRVKRVVREVFRLRSDRLPKGFDLVVSPRDYARACDFEAVSKSFDALEAKLQAGKAP
jgi:ribonuclease P protein component